MFLLCQNANSASLWDAIPFHWLTINKTGQTNIHQRLLLNRCLTVISITPEGQQYKLRDAIPHNGSQLITQGKLTYIIDNFYTTGALWIFLLQDLYSSARKATGNHELNMVLRSADCEQVNQQLIRKNN